MPLAPMANGADAAAGADAAVGACPTFSDGGRGAGRRRERSRPRRRTELAPSTPEMVPEGVGTQTVPEGVGTQTTPVAAAPPTEPTPKDPSRRFNGYVLVSGPSWVDQNLGFHPTSWREFNRRLGFADITLIYSRPNRLNLNIIGVMSMGEAKDAWARQHTSEMPIHWWWEWQPRPVLRFHTLD